MDDLPRAELMSPLFHFIGMAVFFSDIVGYTNMSSQMTPIEVMQMLGDLYTKFDVLAKKHNVYKVETIGDAYIAISGAPMKVSPIRPFTKDFVWLVVLLWTHWNLLLSMNC